MPYHVKKIDVAGGAIKEPWFRAINPKAKAPTLVLDDGCMLTKFSAIAVVSPAGLSPEPVARRPPTRRNAPCR